MADDLELSASIGLDVQEGDWRKADALINGLAANMRALVAHTANISAGLSSFKNFAVGAFAAVRGAMGLGEIISETTEYADNVSVLAQQTGLATDAIQELGHASKLSDVEAGSLFGSLKKLSAGLTDAATTGKGPAADALRALGISVGGLKKKLAAEGGLDTVFGELADKFAEMPDGATKTSRAMDLFGKSGADLIPLLNKGRDGIAELRAEAQRLGIVMSEQDLESIGELGDQTDKLGEVWGGFKRNIVAAFAPLIKDALPHIQAALVAVAAWVKENGPAIAEFVGDVARGVVKVVQTAIAIIQKLGRGLADIGRWVRDGVRTAINAVRDLVTSVGEFFGSVADGVRGAWETVIAWIEAKVKWLEDKYDSLVKKIKNTGKETLDKLGVAKEDQTPGAQAAATIAEGAIPGFQWILDNFGANTGAGDAGGPAMRVPARESTVINNTVANPVINVQSNASDPGQVADEVARKLQSEGFWGMDPADAQVDR